MFKPTYLYVKTHNKTGLKYFGKTIKDPFKYEGSGKYWKNHIKAYGYDVSTQVIGLYTDEDECKRAAMQFSIDNDVVNSPLWANMMIEDGVHPNINMTQDIHNRAQKTLRDRYGDDYHRLIASKPKTDKHKEAIRQGMQGKFGGFKNKGLIRVKIQCPHCGKKGANNVMTRFHFNKCKSFAALV